ncbi:MAG TPA: phage portal protein, partial [bacterium]|nr:phage portal protein [bacterium]
MPPSLVDLKERPILNAMFIPTPNTPSPRSFDLNTLILWIKRTPECIGIGKRLATDIVTPIYFTPIESPKKPGRPSDSQDQERVDKANLFARTQNFRPKATASVIDWAFTGDNYLWKGKITDDMIKESAIKHYKDYGIELKEIDTKQFFDEYPSGLSAIELVPSSMVRVKHNDFKITKFVQRDKANPGNEREFNPDEIIHGKFMEIDGSVYGYSPMEASYVAIRTVSAIQDYSWYYFENGAKLDRVWKYMGNPNPEYWEKFKNDVAQYISIKKSHGHLFVAGAENIQSEVLNELSEEMEYRNLAIHSIGRLAFAFNMPADILSAILGKDIKQSAGSSDVEDAGYNRNIERAQEYFEDLWNTQLWVPHFQVEMHFTRTFKQDQIRKVQYMGQAVPVADFFQKNKFPLKDEFYYDLFQIDKSFLKEGTIDWVEEEMPQPFAMPNKQTIKGPASQSVQEQKKKQQKPQQ